MTKNFFRNSLVVILLVFIVINQTELFNGKGQSQNYYFQKSWGGEGDSISSPYDVLWGPNGTIIVGNYGLDRLTVITPGENTYRNWGSSGLNLGEFQGPYGITQDRDGNFYVTEYGVNKITKLNAMGQGITSWKVMAQPSYLAADAEGNIYISEDDTNTVKKYTSSGVYLLEWGGTGNTPGKFSRPRGIAIDSKGFVYVVDSWNDRVQKFTQSGVYISSFGSSGSGEGQFNWPIGIAIGLNDTIYVTDSTNNNVSVFSSSGEYLNKWGSTGSGNGEFNRPKGISINVDGELLVADAGNNRVQRFKKDGTFFTQYGWIKGYSNKRNFQGPIVIDRNGNIYMVHDYKVQKFNQNMELQLEWGGQGTNPGQFSSFDGMAIDKDGNIYINDDFRIQKFSSNGTWIKQWVFANSTPFSRATELAVGPDYSMYVVDFVSKDIHKLSSDGVYVKTWGAPTDIEWLTMPAIVVGADGFLYAVEFNRHQINKFSLDGDYITSFGSLESPGGITVDNDYIYVADTFGSIDNQIIQIYDYSGNLITTFGSPGIGPGKFSVPLKMAVDPWKNIYVMDGSGLQKFSVTITNTILNGSFEDPYPLKDWTFGGRLPVVRGTTKSSGAYSLQLGQPVAQTEQGEGFAWAHQTLYVNPAMPKPYLLFDYNIHTNDILHYSDFFVQIQDGIGLNHLATVVRDGYLPCSGSASPPAGTDLGWRKARFDLTPYRGQYIRVTFANRNLWPISYGIWTFVDNVRVEDMSAMDNYIFLPSIRGTGMCK